MRKIDDTSKDKENVTHSEKSKESNQDEDNRRKESHAKCNEFEHSGDNFKGKSFKPISNFYYRNCHGYGHYAIDCKNPKFDNDNENSRMFRNTKHAGNKRRSHSNESGERRQIVFYRCNNLGHITKNCRVADNQNNEQRRNVPVCQLCNNFGHIEKFCRMDRRNLIGITTTEGTTQEMMTV